MLQGVLPCSHPHSCHDEEVPFAYLEQYGILFIASVQVQKQEYTFFVRFFLFFSFLYQVVHILLAEMTPLPPFFQCHMKQTHFKDFYKFVLLIHENIS